MALDYPYSSVPLGRAGTGAAYVYDQNQAVAPLHTAERLAYRRQVREQYEAARRAKAAQAEAARIAAVTLSGQPGQYHTEEYGKHVQNLVGLQADLLNDPNTPGGYAALKKAQNEALLFAAQSKVADEATDKALANITPANGYTTQARQQAIHALLYDENHVKRDPAGLLAAAQQLNPNNPDWIDEAGLQERAKQRMQMVQRDYVYGSTAPGGRRSTDHVEAPSFLADENGQFVYDTKSHQLVPDWNSPRTSAFYDSDPLAKIVIDSDLAKMQAVNPNATRGDAMRARFGGGLRLNFGTDESNNPYGPQARASTVPKLKEADWVPTNSAGMSQFGAHGAHIYDTQKEYEVIPGFNGAPPTRMLKSTSTPGLDRAPALTYARLQTSFANGGEKPPTVSVQLVPGTQRVLPNGRRDVVKNATTAQVQNPTVEFVVVRRDGVPFLGKDVADGDEVATVATLKQQIDQAKRTGGVFQMSVAGDVLDRDAVVGDGTNDAPATLGTTGKGRDKHPADDKTRSASISHIINPMSQVVAGQLARKSPGYNAYAFTPAQLEVLQYAVDKGVSVRGVPPQYLPKKRAASMPSGGYHASARPAGVGRVKTAQSQTGTGKSAATEAAASFGNAFK